MRQRVDQGLDEVVLRSLHHRCHHDGKSDAGHDPRDRHQCLTGAVADMGPGDRQDQVHGAAGSASNDRTRDPFVILVVAGEATSSPSLAPLTISTKPVPRMPISTLRRRARSFSIVSRLLLTTALAGTRRTSSFSRLTILASTLIPTPFGVSLGKPILTRNVLEAGSPAGVMCFTKPGSTWPANASVRSNAFWPAWTRGISSSLTPATTHNGFSRPMR